MRRKAQPQAAPHWSPEDAQIVSDARRRLSRLDTLRLLDWADTCGSGMSKGFDDYRKFGDLASIEEIAEGLLTLWAVTLELRDRAVLH